VLTIFIGGNHEASNYLRDLYFGGWAAPNIYFLGCSGVIDVKIGEKSLTICGMSGIEGHYDFKKGYYEQ
jgi:lariat debranching enzyme